MCPRACFSLLFSIFLNPSSCSSSASPSNQHTLSILGTGLSEPSLPSKSFSSTSSTNALEEFPGWSNVLPGHSPAGSVILRYKFTAPTPAHPSILVSQGSMHGIVCITKDNTKNGIKGGVGQSCSWKTLAKGSVSLCGPTFQCSASVPLHILSPVLHLVPYPVPPLAPAPILLPVQSPIPSPASSPITHLPMIPLGSLPSYFSYLGLQKTLKSLKGMYTCNLGSKCPCYCNGARTCLFLYFGLVATPAIA